MKELKKIRSNKEKAERKKEEDEQRRAAILPKLLLHTEFLEGGQQGNDIEEKNMFGLGDYIVGVIEKGEWSSEGVQDNFDHPILKAAATGCTFGIELPKSDATQKKYFMNFINNSNENTFDKVTQALIEAVKDTYIECFWIEESSGIEIIEFHVNDKNNLQFDTTKLKTLKEEKFIKDNMDENGNMKNYEKWQIQGKIRIKMSDLLYLFHNILQNNIIGYYEHNRGSNITFKMTIIIS